MSSRTRKSSAYHGGFEQHLIDHGIYPDGHDDMECLEEPANWEDINDRLVQPRPSLSPSHFSRDAFLNFKKANREAMTENKVMSKAFSIIAGTADIPSQENLPFGNLKDLTDGTITKAQPDFYDGSRPDELNKRIRDELGPYIVPSTNTAAPCLPNFFTEGKGPKGTSDVCKRQALYDGALGARGIHELRSYVDLETPFDNNAYTITSTYHHSGLLTMYTTHPTISKDGTNSTQYRMTQLNGWHMTGNINTFREGAAAVRNARDWAKETREKLIGAANRKAPYSEHSGFGSSTDSFASLSPKDPAPLESETSADELAVDGNTSASSNHRIPVGARVNPIPNGLSNRRVKKAAFGVNGRAGGGPSASERRK